MARKSIQEEGFVLFADRALSFEIPEHEIDNLSGHVDRLLDAAVMLNHALSLLSRSDLADDLDADERALAANGTDFILGMANALKKIDASARDPRNISDGRARA